MKTKIKKIKHLLLLIGVYFFLSQVFANNLTSPAYSSQNECIQAKEKNNKLYPSYVRSNCYIKDGYWYYQICDKNEKCDINLQKNLVNVWTSQEISNNDFWSCRVSKKYTLLNLELQTKLDNLLIKLNSKLSNQSGVVRGLVYGFYDYMLNKLVNSAKYKNNEAVKQVFGYLSDKFVCAIKKLLTRDMSLTNSSYNEEVDDFLKDAFGVSFKEGSNKNKTSNTLERDLNNFITFMQEKWVSSDLLRNYVNNYKLLPDSYRSKLKKSVDNLTSDEIATGNNNAIYFISFDKLQYKNLPLWIGNDKDALKYCQSKYGTWIKFVYRLVSPLSRVSSLSGKNFYYLSNGQYKLSTVKYGNPKILNYVLVGLVCGNNKKKVEREWKEKVVEFVRSHPVKKIINIKKKYYSIKMPTYKNLPLWIGNDKDALKYCQSKYWDKITTVYRLVLPLNYVSSLSGKNFYYLSNGQYKLSTVKYGNPKILNYVLVSILCGQGYTKDGIGAIWQQLLNKLKKNLNQPRWKKVCTVTDYKFSKVYGTYTRDRSNLRDWHRWTYCNGLGSNYDKRKVVASGKKRDIYVYTSDNVKYYGSY